MSKGLCSLAIGFVVVYATGLLAQSGSITFRDYAPPVSEADKAQTNLYLTRAKTLADAIDRMARVVAASDLVLKQASSRVVPTGSSELESSIGAWKAAAGALFTPSAQPVLPTHAGKLWNFPQPTPAAAIMWSMNPDAIAPYVASSLKLAQELGKLPSAPNGTPSLTAIATAAKNDQLDWLDTLIAEHGILNRSLRYHPYTSMGQVPVSCQLITNTSRDFRCATQGAIPPGFCAVENVQSFPVEQWPGTAVVARKSLIDDKASHRELVDTLVLQARSARSMAPKCG